MSKGFHLITGKTANIDGLKLPARGRRQSTPGKMNKTEEAYSRMLDILKRARLIVEWRFEPIRFRLADRTTYTPDFMVMYPSGLLEFVEVKGHWEDDARVKIKVVAEMYWMFSFVGVQGDAKDGTGWKRETFGVPLPETLPEKTP